METQLRLSAEPIAKALVLAFSAVLLSSLSFGTGWLIRYSLKDGIPAAIERLQDRLEIAVETLRKYPFFDRVFNALLKAEQEDMGFALFTYSGASRQPWLKRRDLNPPPPTKTPSAAPSATPSPGATRKPSRSPRPPAVYLVKSEVLAYVARAEELAANDKAILRANVELWKKPVPDDVIKLAEKLDTLVHVRDALRRRFLVGLFQLQSVLELFKYEDPDANDRIERIFWGWDVPDVRAAYVKSGTKGVLALAAGRPMEYFLKLAKEYAPFKVCRDNLQELADKKVAPEGPAGAAPAKYQCPIGGRYELKPQKPWRCTTHGSVAEPFARAVHLVLYMDPVDQASKLATSGQPDPAMANLQQHLRLYPNQVFAANAQAEIFFDAKSWVGVRDTLKPWLARCPRNARWLFWLAVAHHAMGDVEGARKYAQEVRKAEYGKPPPNVATKRDYYLIVDRSQDVLEAVQKGIQWGDYQFRGEDDYPSSTCFRNLTELKNGMVDFAQRYPATHPELLVLRQKRIKLAEIMKRLKPGPKMDQAKAKEAELQGRREEILKDTAGQNLWKAMARMLQTSRQNACPAGGRYTFVLGDSLDCSVHRDIFTDRIALKGKPQPTPPEQVLVARAILQSVLTGDPRRKACFDLQLEFVSSRGPTGIPAGVISTGTAIAGDKVLTCPAGGEYRAESRAGGTRVGCSYHGSCQDYFSGFENEPSGGEH